MDAVVTKISKCLLFLACVILFFTPICWAGSSNSQKVSLIDFWEYDRKVVMHAILSLNGDSIRPYNTEINIWLENCSFISLINYGCDDKFNANDYMVPKSWLANLSVKRIRAWCLTFQQFQLIMLNDNLYEEFLFTSIYSSGMKEPFKDVIENRKYDENKVDPILLGATMSSHEGQNVLQETINRLSEKTEIERLNYFSKLFSQLAKQQRQ